MKVVDVNTSLLDQIEKVLCYRYSIAYITGQPNRYFYRPTVRFDGHNLVISDQLSDDLIIPGDYHISVSGNSVLIYSPDKSVSIYCMGFSNLGSTAGKEFDRYYSSTRFRLDLENLTFNDFNPEILEILRDFIEVARSLKTVNPNNQIRLEGLGLDFILSVSYKKAANVYSLSEEESEFNETADSLKNLLNLLGEHLSEYLGFTEKDESPESDDADGGNSDQPSEESPANWTD